LILNIKPGDPLAKTGNQQTLSGLVSDFEETSPRDSSVFVFINKKRDKVKLLHWVGSGYLLYYKRLEEGTFELPRYEINPGMIRLSYTQMIMLIDGISIVNIHKRKRYLQCKKSI